MSKDEPKAEQQLYAWLEDGLSFAVDWDKVLSVSCCEVSRYHRHVRCLSWQELQLARKMHGIQAGQAVRSIKVTLKSYL